MSIDIIHPGPGSRFVERWADRKLPRRSCGPRPYRWHGPEVRAAAVAAYGHKSMSLIAQELGVSVGTVSHWWADAKRDGLIAPLFGRFDGGKVRAGRLSRDGKTGGTRVEPSISRDARRRLDAPRAPAERGEG